MSVVLSPDLVLYPTVHLAVSVLVLLRLLLLVKPGRGVVGRHGQDLVEGGTNPIWFIFQIKTKLLMRGWVSNQ